MRKKKIGRIEKIKRRKKRVRLEDLPVTVDDTLIQEIARTLAKQIDKEHSKEKYATAKAVLALVGIGVFLVAAVAMPNLPLALKPFLKKNDEHEAWKRFNIPYLKRTLRRLQKQKFVEISEEQGMQVVKITEAGRRRVLRFAIDEIAVEKPKVWDGRWRIVSYDIPKKLESLRNVFREYLRAWGFYPFHESLFLHAYPCGKQVAFLREYLGISEYVRILQVSKIENDKVFRDFFEV